MQPDAWESYCNLHQAGEAVRGKAVRKTSFGVFVELADGVEGLCHISEIWPEPVDKRSLPLEIDQEYEFRILKMAPADRKIALSQKALHQPVAPAATEKPAPSRASSSGETTTIGELVAMKERQAVKN